MPSLKSILSKLKKRKPKSKGEIETAKKDFDKMAEEMTKDLNIKKLE